MNRRTVIKLGASSSSFKTIPILKGSSKENETLQVDAEPVTSEVVQFQMGDLELFILKDGYLSMTTIQPIVAPDISMEDFNRVMAELFPKTEDVKLSLNILLINTGTRKILIDTGLGPHFGKNGGWLPQSLEKAGISINEITDIYITHAHRDHIGGIVDKEGALIFPNAQYYISQKEFDFWTGQNPDFSKSKYQGNKERTVAFSKNILKKIESKIYFIQFDEVLFNCLKTELAEGHTPGHTIFSLSSKDKTLMHIADIVHHQILTEKPDWGIQFDVDFNMGIATRRKVLNKVAKHKDLVLSMHLPWPGIGHIIKKNNSFTWIPLV